jgi:2-polyprenyl-3-methyl-5-hydroxy-6-metoxy-1,4-benzoquinol methylase
MNEHRLPMISVEESSPSKQAKNQYFPSRQTRKKEKQAKFERLWLLDPEQFNPLRNCMQRERLERTYSLVKHAVDLNQKRVVDLGCGAGVLTRRLREAGAHVTAVDIAENALKILQKQDMRNIEARQDALPDTSLSDDTFNVVICTEIIAELPPEDYRLFFAELARLVKPGGWVVCSSAIDIYTEGGCQRLLNLAETELEIIHELPSYHALYLRLKQWCEAPSKFVKGWEDQNFRQFELNQRSGLNWAWFYLNTTFLFMWFWVVIQVLMKPLLAILKQNRTLLLVLEKICRYGWDERGISHLIFLAKRKALTQLTPVEPTIERPKRKEIWS